MKIVQCYWDECRSSRTEVSVKKVFSEILLNSLENTCVSLFLNKFAGLRPATLLKKRLWHRCFPVNFAKLLITLFLTEHLWWLFLWVIFFKGFLSILGNFSENVFFQWVVLPKLSNRESVFIPANYCRYQCKCEVESSSKGQNIFVEAK